MKPAKYKRNRFVCNLSNSLYISEKDPMSAKAPKWGGLQWAFTLHLRPAVESKGHTNSVHFGPGVASFVCVKLKGPAFMPANRLRSLSSVQNGWAVPIRQGWRMSSAHEKARSKNLASKEYFENGNDAVENRSELLGGHLVHSLRCLMLGNVLTGMVKRAIP